MIRRIIHIDEEKCDGCGACAGACHEGAIAVIGGKARLTREDYCDGLGDCLPVCPAGAISFEEREAAAYDEEAAAARGESSRLSNWPVQIKLAPVRASYFGGAALLVAADCTAYAYAAMHSDFITGKVTLIGCPKLDGADYSEKLSEIIRYNDIQSVTVARMEVPCCEGLEIAVEKALQASGKTIPRQAVKISIEGRILERWSGRIWNI